MLPGARVVAGRASLGARVYPASLSTFEETPMTEEQHPTQAIGFASAHGWGRFAFEEMQ